jgi:thiamine-phosphate pyrophosphorylase
MNRLPRLYAIADASFGNPVRLAEDLFSAGIRLLQIRNKKAGARELLLQVETILAIAPSDSFVIVNDRVDVARIAAAGGVHLGQTDLPVTVARGILGAASMIGFSTHNLAEAQSADQMPVDYIAVGPVFETSSKENPDPVLGVRKLEQICKAVRKPVVAIGGIKLRNLDDVFGAGAQSVAVISGLLDTTDIVARTKEWMNAC